jgi:isoquinoline 1-oxidoreductase beta subunit
MSAKSKISRREFLKVSTAAGAGLVIGFYLPGCQSPPTATPEPTASPTAPPEPTASPMATPEPTAPPTATPDPSARFEPNAFLSIDGSGRVTITVPRPEIGQGVRTSLAMIVAEELEADWSTIRVEQAMADRKYGNQVTGGSRSIMQSYMTLRKAGAAARAMLIAAAAQTWGVEKETCYAENGAVIHQPSGRRLTFGELVETAATVPAPSSPEITLKDPKDFRIIGTRLGQLDNPQFVDGSAIYGIDVQIPGMLYATLARCPVFGGQVASFDATQAKAVPGVRHVVQIQGGVAVVADNTWAAMKGRQALEITWDEGPNADLSSAGVRQRLTEQAQTQAATSSNDDAAGAGTTLEAVYEIPFLAHATPEPMNCVADVRDDFCEVWAPTQAPQDAKLSAMSRAMLPEDAVRAHIPLIGGGFGRRLGTDYVEQAVQISKAVGAPIKLVWTREDDIQHDFYHPLSVHRASARLDEPSLPRVRSYPARTAVPTGYWRSVENFTNAFVRECFLDELAAALGRDPYELRLELEPKPLKAVLELAATKAGWGTPLPDGWGRGIACHSTWNSTPVAEVAEVSVAEDGTVQVHRVVCAVDCGTVINPDMVEAQMEGGIVFGLTAALKAEITIKNGRVQQSNFHDYPVLRIDEMPVIEVYIMPSDEKPRGVGEMGIPPIAPAVANAVFAATGKRIRRLPIRPQDIREA